MPALLLLYYLPIVPSFSVDLPTDFEVPKIRILSSYFIGFDTFT